MLKLATETIYRLVDFAEAKGLVYPIDHAYAVNRLLDIMQLPAPEMIDYTPEEVPETATKYLETLADCAFRMGNISNSRENRDLFITKAGPNAILDSVMMGTPIIADYYGSPIEKATKRLFVDTKKCGYYIKNVKDIRKKVEELARDEEQMDVLRENIKFFDKRINGAEQIADDIARQLGVTEKEKKTV